MGRSGGLREVLISALNTPTWTHQEEEHVSATPRPRVGPAVWGPPGDAPLSCKQPPMLWSSELSTWEGLWAGLLRASWGRWRDNWGLCLCLWAFCIFVPLSVPAT